ncbi:MAG: hypothetical protein WC725_04940 [Patescibacteria group bacterium]|jgi:hypothetical protein
MNDYLALKKNQADRLDLFTKDNMFFAFSKQQLEEGMKSLGVTDTSQLSSIPGGGIILKDKVAEYKELGTAFSDEMQKAIDSDTTGEGFIYNMFLYELDNHEYSYTGELDQTLDALDLTLEAVNASQPLLNGLNLAIKKQRQMYA